MNAQGNLFHELFDPPLSEAEKVRGETLAESHLSSWRERADEWVGERVGCDFTSEDMQRDIGQPTDKDDRPTNNGVGGYIAGLARRGIIVKVGWTRSERVTNHCSDLRVWRIVKAPNART